MKYVLKMNSSTFKPFVCTKLIQIELIELSGLVSCLESLRYPFGLQCRSESVAHMNLEYDGSNGMVFKTSGITNIDKKDMSLLSSLVGRGVEHSKVVRGIVAYISIKAPRYFWQEMDTYRSGVERLASESTMHIACKGMDTDTLLEHKANLPEGTMQKRMSMFSYQALRRIYKQRRDHRLPQWGILCDFIETLPFANELIIK